jgi:hemerythrin-like metal-binding protein
MSNADEAMYAAKELGRNRVQVFSGVERMEEPSASECVGTKASFPVMRLVWHDAYLCGEPFIDQEHREIFDLANELIHAVVSGDENIVDLYDALDDLVASAESHFVNEERVLSRFHYPDLEEHVLEHQNLMARAQVLRRKAIAGELTLGALVTFIVQDVVVKHMLMADRKYYPLLKASQASTPVESTGMQNGA